MDNADPIDVDEAKSQMRYVRRAMNAESDEERRAALADGILAFGVRFGNALDTLAEIEETEGTTSLVRPLLDESKELFTNWVTGTSITERADEDERRAVVAAELAEQNPALGAIGADAILALPEDHPHRDVERARALIERYIEAGAVEPGAELRAINVLIGIGVAEDSELEALLERGSGLAPSVDDEGVRRGFRVGAAGACLLRAVDARDEEGDVAAQHAWVQRGVDALGTDDLSPAMVSLLAALHALADDEASAAETFARAGANPGASDIVRRQAAMFEARLRYDTGEYERIVELLGPQLAGCEERYLTALSAEAIESAGSELGDAVINLAFALAQLGRWSEALRVLDRGRSLRARYRAALRRSQAGEQLLALERDLYRLERGLDALDPTPERDEDRLAQAVLPRTRLLEAYRRLRPQLAVGTVERPDVAELAGVLARDEAGVLLGVTSSEVLLAAIVPGDDEAPRFARVVAFDAERWMQAFGVEDGQGWLIGIESGAPRAQLADALGALLALAGLALGELPAELAARGVRRLVVVPHRWLHLVPWWAVPALDGFELVQTAPSAADLVASRRATTPELGDSALVVANPTGDLRAAPAEAAAVGRRLAGLGITCTRLDGPAATEEAVIGAMRRHPGVLHFCGHGHSDLVNPDRSALLLHPHVDAAAGDPFAAWAAAVAVWDEHDGGRAGEVPGVGRLVEDDTDRGRVRRLEHGSTGTLWGQYDGDRLARVAELWTAGDMLVSEALEGCALAVLSACESGSGSLGVAKIDEAAGLPAAMRLAGAATVVGTLWPVGDALGALFVDMLYARLAEHRGGEVDLAELVQSTREDLRALPREAAGAGIDALRRATVDPIARFTLEAFGAEVAARPGLPFADAYDWAPFFTTGTGRASVPALDAA
jgi:tetratricopeptide (TPR) repeat protein